MLAGRKGIIRIQVDSVMRMSGPGRERGVTPVDRRWPSTRTAALIYHWLCIFSCLSAAGPCISLRSDSEIANAPVDLDTQLEEILDYVCRQERIWRLENRLFL